MPSAVFAVETSRFGLKALLKAGWKHSLALHGGAEMERFPCDPQLMVALKSLDVLPRVVQMGFKTRQCWEVVGSKSSQDSTEAHRSFPKFHSSGERFSISQRHTLVNSHTPTLPASTFSFESYRRALLTPGEEGRMYRGF